MPLAPAAKMPAPAQALARSVSRGEVVALGQTGPPWTYIPVALQALRARPEDHELRFLLAAAFARLLLVTPAQHHLALLPDPVRTDPGVRALTTAVAQLPTDRITLAELEATCAANVAALSRSGGPSLVPRTAEWREQAARWQWLRAKDGNIVRRRVPDGGLDEQWIGLVDVKGQVDALTLPHSTTSSAATGGNTPPYILEGIDPPWLVSRVLRETPVAADGYQARVTIVQEDVLELLDGLAQVDLADVLGDPRVRVIVGPGAGQNLRDDLLSRLDRQLTGPGLSMSTVRTKAQPGVEACLQTALRAQAEEQRRLLARVQATYAGRDAAWWRDRLGNSLAHRSPLNILIPTCRFSTYIKHAAADLAAAFEGMGHRARVLIEPDDHAHLSDVGYLRTIAGFEPDLVVMINYARANINGLPKPTGTAQPPAIHPNIPYVMWLQDAMPHQLDARVGASMGPLDFIAGNLREECFQRFGYPRSRSLDATIVASGRKFHDRAPSPALRDRHTCDLAYVSHHSETPRAMHERKRREAASNPLLVDLIDRILPGIKPIADDPLREPISTRLRALIAASLRDRGGDHGNESLIAQLMHMYAMPMADRILRHRTLEWAAEICSRRNWRLHLYGRGWENHPMLASHARGELAHDEDLRASYHCAAAHLQVSAHTVIHQRIIECALSGGLPIMRAQNDDLSSLEFSAALHAAAAAQAESRGCDACDPFTLIRGRWRRLGYSIAATQPARRVAALHRALGLPEQLYLWLNSVHADKLAVGAALESLDIRPERSLFSLFDDPAPSMFASRDQLERRLDLAINDRAWRTARARELRDRVRTSMTTEAFAERLLRLVGSGLEPTTG
ncbi:MAG: hypothetical protein IT438_11970 [Phycisphaerales bacterium]|nr:hypothetical protein [Phycisphaerales bacterium]